MVDKAVLVRVISAGSRVLCAIAGLAIAVGLVVGVNAVLAPDLRAWLGRLGPLWALVAAAAAVGAARLGWPPGRLLMRLPARAFAAAVFVVALASGAWAHFAIEKGVPDVPDEFGYLHQARGFADGVVAPPSPPLAELHYVSWSVHDHGKWYAVFPPGYGVLLAAGVKVGAPWLVNPILGALLALVLFALGREVLGGDGVAARAAVVIYLCSWFRLMHAGSFMAHPTAALFTALAVLGIWRGVLTRTIHGPTEHGRRDASSRRSDEEVGGGPTTEERRTDAPQIGGQATEAHGLSGLPGRSVAWGTAGGASVAALLATRPLNAVILGVVLAPAVLYALLVRRAPVRRLLAPIAGAAPILLAYGLYNQALTGSAFLAPQERYMQLKEERGDCFRLGFGPGVGQCPITQNTNFGPQGFQPKHAGVNTMKRLNAYAAYSFALAPLALLPAVGLWLGAFGVAPRRRALLGWMMVASVLGYGLFFYHGVAYGARFLYETWPFVALLSGAAIGDAARLRGWIAPALGGLLVGTLASGMVATWPAIQQHAGKRNRTRDGAILKMLRAPELANAVIFSDSMVVPAAMMQHPARIADNHPILVGDAGDPSNAGFMRQYPDRKPYRQTDMRLTPLRYPADAPVRQEGGRLYPLEVAENGFGDRASSDATFKLPLAQGDALRFRARAAGARFAFQTWTPDDVRTLRVVVAAHPKGPAAEVLVDGTPVGSMDTRADVARLDTHDLPVQLSPGRHWIEVRFQAAGLFFLDYVELLP